MPGAITEILEEMRRGDPGAKEELFNLVHGELKRLATSYMRREAPNHTLQPTALVNETYLRLLTENERNFKDRCHFMATAAHAMRLILVDFARARQALKRGGGQLRVTFDEAAHEAADHTERIVAVHEALERLEEIDPQKSRLVELRFFGGLGFEEAAEVLGVSERSVYRVWEQARAWLYREISK